MKWKSSGKSGGTLDMVILKGCFTAILKKNVLEASMAICQQITRSLQE